MEAVPCRAQVSVSRGPPMGLGATPARWRISRSPRCVRFIASADRIRYEPGRGTCAPGARPHPPAQSHHRPSLDIWLCVGGAALRRTRCRSVSREKGSPPFFDRLLMLPAVLSIALAQPPPLPPPPLLSHVLLLAALTMLLWQVAKIEGLDISGLPDDPGAFQDCSRRPTSSSLHLPAQLPGSRQGIGPNRSPETRDRTSRPRDPTR